MSNAKIDRNQTLTKEEKMQKKTKAAQSELERKINEVNNPDFELCSIVRNGVTYALVKNGEGRYSSLCGMLRVPMRPSESDRGHVYEHETGVVKLLTHIFENKNIKNNIKYLYCCRLAPEYYGNRVLVDTYKQLTRGVQSPDGAYKLTDWEKLIEKKQAQYQTMVEENENKKLKDKENIARIKQMFTERS